MKLIADLQAGRHIHQEGCEMTLDPRIGPYVEISIRDALSKFNPHTCLVESNEIFVDLYFEARANLNQYIFDLEEVLGDY